MNRIGKLQELLADRGIGSAILLYHRDVFYYAGTARPAALAVTPGRSVLFTRRAGDLIAAESVVTDVRQGGLTAIGDWMAEEGLEKEPVAVELDLIPANMYLRLKELLPASEIVDLSPLVLGQRLLKDEEEIRHIRAACRVAEAAHRHVPEILAPGMTELELAAELERAARLAGHETFAILRKRMETEMGYALVLAGQSTNTMGGYGQVVTGNGLSRAFPYGPSNRKVARGDVVVFDIAGLSEGYHSDLARTYFVGSAPAPVVKAHDTLLAVQSGIIAGARPGAAAKGIYKKAVEAAAKLGWGDYFQGSGRNKGTFVGHGLGLEIDEPPLLGPRDETVLRENMTFTTELFVVHPDFGEVKLEDTVLVGRDRTELLTGIDRRVIEVGQNVKM